MPPTDSRTSALACLLAAALSLAAAPALAAPGLDGPRVVRAVPVPQGFVGHLALEPETNRLWLVSFGPPANPSGPSRLYEVDPATGRVLRQAELPLQGSFAPPVAIAGRLYVGVYWESRIHEISTGPDDFGRVLRSVPVPGTAALGLGADGHYRYPFLEFAGLAADAGGNLLVQASHAGELITLDRETGAVLRRVPILPGLGGIAAVQAVQGGRPLLIANRDPENAAVVDKVMRFDVQPARTPVPTKRSRWGSFAARPDAKRVSWLLLDPETGAVLVSTEVADSPAHAASTALLGREEAPGTPFGRFRLLALGAGGLLTLEWTPEPEDHASNDRVP